MGEGRRWMGRDGDGNERGKLGLWRAMVCASAHIVAAREVVLAMAVLPSVAAIATSAFATLVVVAPPAHATAWPTTLVVAARVCGGLRRGGHGARGAIRNRGGVAAW